MAVQTDDHPQPTSIEFITEEIERLEEKASKVRPMHLPTARSPIQPSKNWATPPPFPVIDYQNHPGYGRKFQADEVDKRNALKKLWPTLQGLWNSYEVSYEKPIDSQGTEDTPELHALVRDGIAALTLDAGTMDLLQRVTEPHARKLRAKRARQIPTKRGVGSSSTIVASRNDNPEFLDLIQAILARSGSLQLAEAYKGHTLTAKFVTIQINNRDDLGILSSCQIDDLPVSKTYYTHVDTTIFGMKVIIYLNTVTEKNGPFRYLIGSNRIEENPFQFCLRKACDKSGLDSVKPENRRLFSALPSNYQAKANFGNDMIDGAPEIGGLLKIEQKFTSDDGNLILFDNCGMHRGAIFESGERQILQILLTA